jgi:hypothetical protein
VPCPDPINRDRRHGPQNTKFSLVYTVRILGQESPGPFICPAFLHSLPLCTVGTMQVLVEGQTTGYTPSPQHPSCLLPITDIIYGASMRGEAIWLLSQNEDHPVPHCLHREPFLLITLPWEMGFVPKKGEKIIVSPLTATCHVSGPENSGPYPQSQSSVHCHPLKTLPSAPALGTGGRAASHHCIRTAGIPGCSRPQESL